MLFAPYQSAASCLVPMSHHLAADDRTSLNQLIGKEVQSGLLDATSSFQSKLEAIVSEVVQQVVNRPTTFIPLLYLLERDVEAHLLRLRCIEQEAHVILRDTCLEAFGAAREALETIYQQTITLSWDRYRTAQDQSDGAIIALKAELMMATATEQIDLWGSRCDLLINCIQDLRTKVPQSTINSEQTAADSGSAAAVTPVAEAPHGLIREPNIAAAFKLILVGDGGTGKSTFLKRHETGEFEKRYLPTVGVNIHQLTFRTTAGNVRFDCWDVGGQETYAKLRHGYYIGAHCAIMMFDVAFPNTYRSIPAWYDEVTKICGAIPMVLVGNKVDLPDRDVTAKMITFHREHKLQYYDVSAKTNFNFEKPFLWLCKRLANDPTLSFVDERIETNS